MSRTPAELADALEAMGQDVVLQKRWIINLPILLEAAALLRSITPHGVVIPEPSESDIKHASISPLLVREVIEWCRANARVAPDVAIVSAYEAGMRDRPTLTDHEVAEICNELTPPGMEPGTWLNDEAGREFADAVLAAVGRKMQR